MLSSSRTARRAISCAVCKAPAFATYDPGLHRAGGVFPRLVPGPGGRLASHRPTGAGPVQALSRGARARSGSTVNAILTAVCDFLRFCARTGLLEPAVAERLSEPRWLRFTPPGFDAGESGQFRTVRARALKARAETPFPDALTAEQVGTVLASCRRPRERFLVILLHDLGLRIGEALGLRRSDMHLLPDSRSLGCATVGAHVHVRRRANPNGALAKSPNPRVVPASGAVLAGHADYQHERAETLGQEGNDMVFANLYHEPLGAPMGYRAAKRFFDRLAGWPVWLPSAIHHTLRAGEPGQVFVHHVVLARALGEVDPGHAAVTGEAAGRRAEPVSYLGQRRGRSDRQAQLPASSGHTSPTPQAPPLTRGPSMRSRPGCDSPVAHNGAGSC